MTTMQAVKTFFAPPPVTMDELKALKSSLSQAEWDQFGKDTCAAMGVEWSAPPSK